MFFNRGGKHSYQAAILKVKVLSTELFDVFQEVIKRIEAGKVVDVVFMQFSKAFDKMSHMVGLSVRLNHIRFRMS